jgi:SNF2 family DNA or RNA helicase
VICGGRSRQTSWHQLVIAGLDPAIHRLAKKFFSSSPVAAPLCGSYANQSPQFIYYLTLFHLFRDFLDGTRDLDDNLRRVALPDTRIWRTLFSFQKDGAKAAINKILDYNGCILADSVGLGKTYTALAVIKFFGAAQRAGSCALSKEVEPQLDHLPQSKLSQSVFRRQVPVRCTSSHRSLA